MTVPRRLIALAALIATPVAAHDFWIDLDRYHVADGAAVSVRLLIGDAGEAEPWETLWRKIVSLRSYGPRGMVDQQAGLRESAGERPGGATLRLAGEGTHVIAFESYQAENDISAEEFAAYAAHEGLTPAIAARREAGREGERGRELYSRRAKALVQVGARTSDDALAVIGQTLELVPRQNPYALPAGAPIEIEVRFRGRPLAGAQVALERLDARGPVQRNAISDARGIVRFTRPAAGQWRATSVWTAPIVHPRAEWDTIFASLTFGD